MSTARLAARRPQALVVNRPALSLATLRSARPGVFIGGSLVIGVLTVALLNLLLSILTSNSVYELSALQKEKRELTTTTQILSEEVDSLSSQQNLSNAAQKLGMISNANPVFLRLEDQRVFGKPKAALNADGRISGNLVPNSALVQQTTAESLIETPAPTINASSVSVVTSNVAKPVTVVGQVISNGGAIPASPTH